MQNDLLKLQQKVAEQAAEIEALRKENAFLHRKIDYINSQRYGQKGERFEPTQLELLPNLPDQTIIIEKPQPAWPADHRGEAGRDDPAFLSGAAPAQADAFAGGSADRRGDHRSR